MVGSTSMEEAGGASSGTCSLWEANPVLRRRLRIWKKKFSKKKKKKKKKGSKKTLRKRHKDHR